MESSSFTPRIRTLVFLHMFIPRKMGSSHKISDTKDKLGALRSQFR